MARELSFECNASKKAIDRIQAQSNDERSQFIINTFVKYFADGIQSNPAAFRGRFRKMAATAFNFYRGSALLFYQDLKIDQDLWIHNHKPAGNVFIHVSMNHMEITFTLCISSLIRAIYMLKISAPIWIAVALSILMSMTSTKATVVHSHGISSVCWRH